MRARSEASTCMSAPVTEEQPPAEPEAEDPQSSRWREVAREITSSSAMVAVLSVLLAILCGSVLIAVTDEQVRTTAGYIFAAPGDFFNAVWDAVWGAYTALFRGSIYNTRAETFEQGIRPLTETAKFAAPLIA